MVEGKSIMNALLENGEGTLSYTGPPVIVDVMKCPQCGRSVKPAGSDTFKK